MRSGRWLEHQPESRLFIAGAPRSNPEHGHEADERRADIWIVLDDEDLEVPRDPVRLTASIQRNERRAMERMTDLLRDPASC